MENLLTVNEAARVTGYDVQHIRRLARDGRIKAKKWGREWMVDKDSLLEYVKSEGRGPKAKHET